MTSKKPKHIIICRDLGGRSSTGIEVKKLYDYLSLHGFDFLFITAYTSIQARDVSVLKQPLIWLPERIQKLIFILFGWDAYSYILMYQLGTILKDNDINSNSNIQIHGFTSSADFYVVEVMRRLVKRFSDNGLKYLHFFDPIPAKEHWGEMSALRNAKIRYLKGRLDSNWKLSSASESMSRYLELLYPGHVIETKYSEIRTDSVVFRASVGSVNQTRKAYYLGTLYGQRKGENLVRAFEGLEGWELHVFGSDRLHHYSESNRVVFHDFVDEIQSLENPDLLIDLDVDVEDVFIPGKSYTYLATEVPILAITPEGSALRGFYGIEEFGGTQGKAGIYYSKNELRDIQEAITNLPESFELQLASSERLRLRDVISKQYFGGDFR